MLTLCCLEKVVVCVHAVCMCGFTMSERLVVDLVVMWDRLDYFLEHCLCSVVGLDFLISMPTKIMVVLFSLIDFSRCLLYIVLKSL